jgi:hypothetical protein
MFCKGLERSPTCQLIAIWARPIQIALEKTAATAAVEVVTHQVKNVVLGVYAMLSEGRSFT